MKFTEYMSIRNTNPNKKNSLTNKEAEILGIDRSRKGWIRRDIDLSPEQLQEAVMSALKSKFVPQGVKDNLRPLYMTSGEGFDKQYLYLMVNSLGMLKLGISIDPVKRARQLSTGSGLEVDVLCYWKLNNPARTTEARLHKDFAIHKIQGEWYKPETLTVAMIEEKFNFNFIRTDF